MPLQQTFVAGVVSTYGSRARTHDIKSPLQMLQRIARACPNPGRAAGSYLYFSCHHTAPRHTTHYKSCPYNRPSLPASRSCYTSKPKYSQLTPVYNGLALTCVEFVFGLEVAQIMPYLYLNYCCARIMAPHLCRCFNLTRSKTKHAPHKLLLLDAARQGAISKSTSHSFHSFDISQTDH